MKTRFAAIAVLAVFVVLVSSAAVATSGSDALDATYTDYYKNQLTPEQQSIYEKLQAHSTNPVLDTGSYYYEFTGITGSEADVQRAWEALKLDDPYAIVTWTKGDIKFPAMTLSAGNLRIATDSMFADATTMLSEAKAKINGYELTGKNLPDRIKSINSVLKGNGFKYDESGAYGVYGILGDDEHKLSAAGFSAVFKALSLREVNSLDVNCMQVYGTLADGSKNMTYAWNIVTFEDGEVYAVDSASNNKDGDNGWLCAGRYTANGGDAFGKVHLAFAFNTYAGLGYSFDSELLCNDGYSWPESHSILDTLEENAPWILVGIICVVLAIYLFITARKGGF